MNIPTKVLRSTYITYETYYHHQQLAKRFYKSSTKSSQKTKPSSVDEQNINYITKHSFKEEILKWFFSMSLPDRIKAVSVENKWLATMVQQMHTKVKADSRVKFQLKLDEISNEEFCLQHILNPPTQQFPNDMNMESFFNFKSERIASDDRTLNESLFLKEIRFFSLKEQNDTITLSPNILQNEDMFRYYMDQFSLQKCFNSFCTVSFDAMLRVYNWEFPEWFNSKEFNSISEFIIVYIEQVLSIRYWFSIEEKKEKLNKKVNVSNFSLCEEPNFNELFDRREKIILFLQAEYEKNKDKLFNNCVNLRELLNEIRNDSNLMSKVKKTKPDSIKNYFYVLNKAKFDIFDAPVDTDHDIIEKFKKIFYEFSEEAFVDELMFCRIEGLYTIEDFLAKKVFDTLHNIYTDRIANDLMMEELSLKKINSDTQKKSKRKPAAKKKKVSSDNELKQNSFESSKNSGCNCDASCGEKSSSPTSDKKTEIKKDISPKTIKEARKDIPQIKESKPIAETKQTVLPIKIDESQKMSWRKKADETPVQKTVENKSTSISSNSYVNTLVKNLINQVVFGSSEEKTQSNEDKEEDKNVKVKKKKKQKPSKDCIIETINHEIIKPGKKLVDNYSQTDTKGKCESNEVEDNDTLTKDNRNKEPDDAPHTAKKAKKEDQSVKDSNKKEPKKNYLDLKKCGSDGYTFGTTKKNDRQKNKKQGAKYIDEEESFYSQIINDQPPKDKQYKYGAKFQNESTYSQKNGNPYRFYQKPQYDYGMYYPQYGVPYRNRMDYPPRGYDNQVYNNYYIINSNVNISNGEQSQTNLNDQIIKIDLNDNRPKQFNCRPNQMYIQPIQHSHSQKPTSHVDSSIKKESTDVFTKIEKGNGPFIFYYRLHNDIIDYSTTVNEAINYLKEIKIYIIQYLKGLIKKSLQCEIIVDLYGSFATDLSIESSDIDITIKFKDASESYDQMPNSRDQIEEMASKLCNEFQNLNVFEYINPILTASVPMVDPIKIIPEDHPAFQKLIDFQHTNAFLNYKFDLEELLKVKVDLTFLEINQSLSNTRSSLDWAKSALSLNPEIKPIIQTLKRYLQIKKLNSSFNGRLLMEFFEFYGRCFNYAQTIIDVNAYIPYMFKTEYPDATPVIIDPVNGHNVSKNSFRIEEVRESFSKVSDYLSKSKILFDKNDLPSTMNIVFDFMVKCNDSC